MKRKRIKPEDFNRNELIGNLVLGNEITLGLLLGQYLGNNKDKPNVSIALDIYNNFEKLKDSEKNLTVEFPEDNK